MPTFETVRGWATTSDMDLVRHSIAPTAFTESIRRRGLTGPRGIRILLDHDKAKPAGVITTLERRQNGLWLEAKVDVDISYVADRWNALAAAKGMNFSVGFKVVDASFQEDRDGEYIRIDKGDLFEVSIVTFPCNEACKMDWREKVAPMTQAERIKHLNDTVARMKKAVATPVSNSSIKRASDPFAEMKKTLADLKARISNA